MRRFPATPAQKLFTKRVLWRRWVGAALALTGVAPELRAQAVRSEVILRTADVFALAEKALDRGDFTLAENAYRALIRDEDIEIRTESRFRLARMYERLDRNREAAVLLRTILDEKPEAAPVRLALAKIFAKIGDLNAAERELRAVRSGDLPPEVARQLQLYSNQLLGSRGFGGALELALAPSTNVNRATRADTLGTVIGDLVLSEDARAKSGVGLSARGQGYSRHSLGHGADLLIQAHASADLYRSVVFNDVSVGGKIGPQWSTTEDRVSVSLVTTRRWYGTGLYNTAYGLATGWQKAVDGATQLRFDVTGVVQDFARNPAQDGHRYFASVALDHAFQPGLGGGIQLYGTRDRAKDRGYSTRAGGLGAYVFRESGRTTTLLSGSYSRLGADTRLPLFQRRRMDDNLTVRLATTFRNATVGTLAPVVRLHFERNRSSIDLYDFRRTTAEVGLVAAF